tara:strand:- start:12206 stop:12598 length:393 start_codon:yes stop_codon:yes gene_type:complete
MTFILAWLLIPTVQGQKSKNIDTVQNIYDAFQKSNATSKDIKSLTPSLNWEEVKSTKEVNERYNITLSAILKNEWRGVTFQNIEVREIEENKVLVTGTVSGRQPTECEGITTAFQHLWTFKDGRIIHVTE